MLFWQLGPTQIKCTCNANDSIYITLCFFNQNSIHLGSYLPIIELFSKYSIIMSDKKMIEDSPTQNPLRFIQNAREKTHSVIRPLEKVVLKGGSPGGCCPNRRTQSWYMCVNLKK